ncbi:hypothetical protein CPB85DRAFT_1559520 [Mucidula mucida]|nr:hypothetical protein CPB85DRAFT_1559520 [Mucidula mucida]
MLHEVSSVRSHHGAPPRSPRERARRASRNEQLAALGAAFRRTRLEPDSNAGSSVSSNHNTNVSTVSRSPDYYAYEPSETSEVSDTSTVCWSDYGGSTVARRPRVDSPPAVSAVSIASRSAGTSRGPPLYESSVISEVSDQSTVCWSDNAGSTTPPASTRRLSSTVVVGNRFNAVPAAIPRDTFIPLHDINDSSAIQIILALIHDCLLAIDKLLLGRRPPKVFASRYRLLSLYVVGDDVRAFRRPLELQGFTLRYSAIQRLVIVRERTLFASREESDHDARRRKGRYEADLMQHIINNDLHEPLGNASESRQTSFQELMRDIYDVLGSRSLSDRTEDISKRIRSFLRIRPFQDVAEFDTSPALTPAREIAMLHDIFFGFWAVHTKAFSGPSDIQFISLAADSRRTHYSKSSRLRHIRDLVLCRDILCGVLPGPSPLTKQGAYNRYFRPVISEQRREYRFCECSVSFQRDRYQCLTRR